jgi:hypothetical protein
MICAIAIHYFTEDNAIAILEKWVERDHKQKTDIFSDPLNCIRGDRKALFPAR